MIYFLVTTCLSNSTLTKMGQYNKAINKLLKLTKNIPNTKCIIIENNGKRKTFLNEYDCDIFYTKNNNIKHRNIGLKELKDIFDCIEAYQINEEDFVVKITGRYLLDSNSKFIKQLYNLKDIDCIIQYGSLPKINGRYIFKKSNKINDGCFTGLIGMRCKYIKKIKQYKKDFSDSHIWVEKKWANVTNLIDKNKIIIPKTLGINICPGSYTYYFM